ncbi:unnamed protein product [Caenorhabditis angaria]|uniref:Glycoprotein hormone subunit beta domain-containing protein n=1 Tax=Caenorhabditis angaria TaxID=860376 RepID=A0A9P1IT01_9PELO|nr:unnamed protein product [Caenorhabditis angaria]
MRSITTTNSTILDNLLFLRISSILFWTSIFTILFVPPPIEAGKLLKPVCKTVGADEIIDEEGCDLLILHINKCSGYCRSQTWWDPLKHETSIHASCCRMVEHVLVETELICPSGNRRIRIPSATKCECFECAVQ